MCYKTENEKDELRINRYGALRLLSIIHKMCSCLAAKERTKTNNNDIVNQGNSPRLYSTMKTSIEGTI